MTNVKPPYCECCSHNKPLEKVGMIWLCEECRHGMVIHGVDVSEDA